MFWDLLTSPEIAALDKGLPVLLPTAATEQHGPHLPLATDRLIIEHFCRELDKRISQAVLILPTMAIGCSAHHMDFAGSLTLDHQAYLEQLEQIVGSAQAHGFTRFLIFNSHGGNQAINSVAADRLGHAQPGCRIATATWWRLAPEALRALNSSGPGGTGHACEFETSLLLHCAPHAVRPCIPTDVRPSDTFIWNRSDMLHASPANLYRSIRDMNATGVVGTPSAASAATGEAITRIVVDSLIPLITDLNS